MFKSINERKATGSDRISSKVLKVCNLELCDIFKFLFNESVVCGTIPSIWKTATIIHVPKKDTTKCDERLQASCTNTCHYEMFGENYPEQTTTYSPNSRFLVLKTFPKTLPRFVLILISIQRWQHRARNETKHFVSPHLIGPQLHQHDLASK